jgi:hypothetical protein
VRFGWRWSIFRHPSSSNRVAQIRGPLPQFV